MARWFGILALGLLATACTPLPLTAPQSTHTSNPPANNYAGLANFGKVTNEIWRGSQPTAAGYKNLIESGKVRSFLSLRHGTNRDSTAVKVGNIQGVQCFQVSMREWDPGQDNLRQLALAVKTLKALSDNPQTRPVYVHCKAGRNRTGFVVATYRMVYQGWTPEEAVREMRAYHFARAYSRVEWFLKNLDVPRLKKLMEEVEVETLKG
jgi:tyrosine-protein phosphatase SIW14